jgi:hypothetical protein
MLGAGIAYNPSRRHIRSVTLNLFQGPFVDVLGDQVESPAAEHVAQWMLKQVQHDGMGGA